MLRLRSGTGCECCNGCRQNSSGNTSNSNAGSFHEDTWWPDKEAALRDLAYGVREVNSRSSSHGTRATGDRLWFLALEYEQPQRARGYIVDLADLKPGCLVLLIGIVGVNSQQPFLSPR